MDYKPWNYAVNAYVTIRLILCFWYILSRGYNYDSTTIRLRSDCDVSRAPASIRSGAKNERVNFSS